MSKYSVQGLKCDSRAHRAQSPEPRANRAHGAQGPMCHGYTKPQRVPETPCHYNFSSIADAAIY